MEAFEEFFVSFGFKDGPFIIAILCIVVLLSNFIGGLISNILLAMSGRTIIERGLLKRTSFRLFFICEASLIGYIAYYHTVLTTGIGTAQIIYWTYVLLAAPLLAMLGAQSSYLIYAKKIEKLKAKGRKGDKGEGDEEEDEEDEDD